MPTGSISNGRNDEEAPSRETESLLSSSNGISNKENTDGRRCWNRKVLFWLVVLSCSVLFLGLLHRALSVTGRFNRRRKNHYHYHKKNEQNGDDWWDVEDAETSETTLHPDKSPPFSSDLRWGIVGLGRIAHDFCTALNMAGANVTAVAAGSLPESLARAEMFSKIYGVPTYYGSYEELALDPNVDIVYIATTNQLHHNNTMLMLKAGKNVLVEKPMAINSHEAMAMARTARKQQRLLLTNYWTRFFPIVQHTRSLLDSRILGEVVAMRGDFGFPAPPDPTDRFLNTTLGGGAMLDVGCYLVNFAVMVSPRDSYPVDIQATVQSSYMGVDYGTDTETSFSLRWGGSVPPSTCGAEKKRLEETQSDDSFTMIMTGQASFRRPSSFQVEIDGTHGRIVLEAPANAPNAMKVFTYEPFGPLKHVESIRSKDLKFDYSYGPEQYPRGSGFVHVIRAIEECMASRGIPGQVENGGCLQFKELSMKEQLTIVNITEDIMLEF